MFIYNVTVHIEDSVHDEWLSWMRLVHIPEVMATGYFLSNKICKVLSDEKGNGTSYAIQYTFKNMSDYETYRAKHAPALQAQVIEKYKDKFVAFRTLLELVSE